MRGEPGKGKSGGPVSERCGRQDRGIPISIVYKLKFIFESAALLQT